MIIGAASAAWHHIFGPGGVRRLQPRGRSAAMHDCFTTRRTSPGSIRWQYHCFDRILLNGLIQPFQQPERVVGFFNTHRQLLPGEPARTAEYCRAISTLGEGWSDKRNIPVVDAPKGRRDEFVDPYFKGADPDAVVIILKAREPARIMTAIGDSKASHCHLQIANRWVVQYSAARRSTTRPRR